jgi:hypothetical protein
MQQFDGAPLMIPIHENYKAYRPPRQVLSTVSKLMGEIPAGYLSDLESVVLTNSTAIGRGKNMRIAGRKHAPNQYLGFYHPAWKGQRAWIEIVVDNVVTASFGQGDFRFLCHVPVLRNMAFGSVLYHEVGHHLHKATGALAAGDESGADAWRDRLIVRYFRKRYWYLVPFLGLARRVAKAGLRRSTQS